MSVEPSRELVSTSGDTAADDDVATAFADGRDWALEEAYRRWSSLVHTIAMRSLPQPADAEDVTQQVFVQAWRSRHTYDAGVRPLAAWLTGITRHVVADTYARRDRERRLAQRLVVMTPSGADRVDDVADAVLVEHLLHQVPEPRREVLGLAFLGHMTHVEVAERTGLPLGTVKSHIRRGLADLRGQMEASDDAS